ncbi:MAG: AMP nucleosidase, partial [Parvularculaceae bacterium]
MMPSMKPHDAPADDLVHCKTPDVAIARLKKLYDEALANVERRFNNYSAGRLSPGEGVSATYPYLCAELPVEQASQTSNLALGRIASATVYGVAITQPALFESYLLEQLERVIARFEARLYVGRSRTPIPLSFALEQATALLTPKQRAQLQFYFHTPNLIATNDDIVDGKIILERSGPLPLSLFSAERVDYSLHRIQHYTATSPEHFQQFVLFTNYQRYVDEFAEFAKVMVSHGEAEAFIEPGDRTTRPNAEPKGAPLMKLPQMPAYHLVQKGRKGVTLVNIGVGPSNAKTITDHLAVLRPHVWLMIGHCGGLRRTQRLGDYVLAHAYLRDDNVLDDVLPASIPLPTIAEVQLALTRAVEEVSAIPQAKLKEHLRTGTVVTTSDRNWELRFQQ